MTPLTTILKTAGTLASAIGLAVAVACGAPAPEPTSAHSATPTPEPTIAMVAPTADIIATPTNVGYRGSADPHYQVPTPAVIATPTNPDQVQEVTVGPQRMECVGVAPQMCLVVNDELFYDEIDGFDHQPGYAYRLRIERYDRWPGQTEIPQDVGRYRYGLLAVLAKQRVAGR